MEGTSLNSSNFIIDPLHENSCSSALKIIYRLIQTCIGPRAKLKLLRHEEGGSVTLTSSSHRLFPLISVKNIFSKIILSAAKSQLKNFNDGALRCAFLTLKLINHALSSEYPLPVNGALFLYFANLYMDCLNCESNRCVVSIDFSDLCHLQSIVLSLLNSKPGCILTPKDKNYLSSLILEAYLMISPSTPELLDDSNIRILTLEGISVNHSKLFKGVLIPVSKMDATFFQNAHDGNGPFRVATFATSLAGDADLPVGNLEMSDSVSLLEGTLSFINSTVEKLISEETNFVFCQKVIHPSLKKKLQNAGVFVVDRLGSENAKFVQLISGGSVNTSLISEISYGSVTSFRMEQVGGKFFLCLFNEQILFFSLVLSNYNSEAAAELQIVCCQAISTLFRILRSGKICYGAGCTEICTAHLWAAEVKKQLAVIQNEVGCTLGSIHDAMVAFTKSITDLSVAIHQGSQLDFATEHAHGHLWKLRDGQFPSGMDRCCCGRHCSSGIESWVFLADIGKSLLDSDLINTEIPKRLILDELSSKAGAMSSAFEMASLILKTSVLMKSV